eukprot:6241043-Prymnesium_polylepis.3
MPEASRLLESAGVLRQRCVKVSHLAPSFTSMHGSEMANARTVVIANWLPTEPRRSCEARRGGVATHVGSAGLAWQVRGAYLDTWRVHQPHVLVALERGEQVGSRRRDQRLPRRTQPAHRVIRAQRESERGLRGGGCARAAGRPARTVKRRFGSRRMLRWLSPTTQSRALSRRRGRRRR